MLWKSTGIKLVKIKINNFVEVKSRQFKKTRTNENCSLLQLIIFRL